MLAADGATGMVTGPATHASAPTTDARQQTVAEFSLDA